MNLLLDRLARGEDLTPGQWVSLLEQSRDPALREELFQRSVALRRQYFGDTVYLRGLIEFTNYCRNDCYYCGIRRSNACVNRYRLTQEEILACCRQGYELGFRTFVLQGGEDPWWTRDKVCALVQAIKGQYPDCAVTLSIGEWDRDSYQAFFDAGADRYLLRHETHNEQHYKSLHPPELSLGNRLRCLQDLKEIGFQVGCGMMVGSPGQTLEHLAEDLKFLKEFQPQMVGIGPFIPQHDTPFRDQPAGTVEMTVFLLGLIRLLLPRVLLPATTALGTLHPEGRELGILAGANVCMPNLSPADVREQYSLYDNKICTGEEAAESVRALSDRIASIGYRAVSARGDHPDFSQSV